jgi:hypothetical protein
MEKGLRRVGGAAPEAAGTQLASILLQPYTIPYFAATVYGGVRAARDNTAFLSSFAQVGGGRHVVSSLQQPRCGESLNLLT